MANTVKVAIVVVTSLFSILCMVAIPLWIFGVPGVDNDYARGWRMGLTVIIAYPIVWAGIARASFGRKFEMTKEQIASMNVAWPICLLFVFVVAVVRLSQAFTLIL